jgi:hypothetical protein
VGRAFLPATARPSNVCMAGGDARLRSLYNFCRNSPPLIGEERRPVLGAERGSFVSAPPRRAIRNPSGLHEWLGEHTFQLAVYLLIPKPQPSITLLVEISRSQPILALLLWLGMLTAVEFNSQVLRDAAEVGK